MATGNDQIPNTEGNVNEQFLASLIEMGIDEKKARQALKLVDSRSVEEALSLVLAESSPSSAQGTDTSTDESQMTYRMLFVVNGSLRMSSGKIAAQVAHCALDLYKKLLNKRSKALDYWEEYGETKIVVRGQSTQELLDIESRAESNPAITTSQIEDAGHTEIVSGSITCVGLFGTKEQLNPITGHLKLMQDCLKCAKT